MARKTYRKNCGPKLVNRVRNITFELFKECREQAQEEIPYAVPMDLLEHLTKVNQRASELYQERIKTLPSKDLEDILWVHECGKYGRAPSTIEGITSELAKREFFGVSTTKD
jgi:hypothetical protein